MAPVHYRPVPTMELSSLPPPPPPRHRHLSDCDLDTETSRSRSSHSGTGDTDHRRCDRRRGRLNAELLVAAQHGNLADVNKKLEEGASVNATCRRGRTTALQLAVACGHLEVARLLLCRGASPLLRDRAGRQAIHLAAAAGSVLLVQLLLDSDRALLDSPVFLDPSMTPDPDCLDSWSHNHASVAQLIPDLSKGASPLHLAAQRLHFECVHELVGRGARLDQTDERGLMPLDVVGELMPDPNTSVLVDLADTLPTTDETNARIENLRQRISANPSNMYKSMHTRLRLPTDSRFNRGVTQNTGKTVTNRTNLTFPLSPPIELPNTVHPSNPPILTRNQGDDGRPLNSTATGPSLALKVVNELISGGASMPKSKVIVKQGAVQNQMTVSMTCLHTAVERQDLQLIEYLLDHGACQLTWNNDGLTPLHLATTLQLLDVLKILLEKNKTTQVVDARDREGRTPLHLAVAGQWAAGAGLLLEAGADIKVTSNDNESVLHLAAKLADETLLDELLTIPESFKVLDLRDKEHETPLFCAVGAGRTASVRLLLAHGADVTATLPGDITLLHVAASHGYEDILQALLSEERTGSLKDVCSKENKGGTTALHLAALGGHVSCVSALLAAGCAVHAVTTVHPHLSSTALHLAAVRGHSRVADVIIRHDRTSLCTKNLNGWYPLHVAARFSKRDCVRLMLVNGANLAATVFDSAGYKKTALDIIVYSIVNPLSFLENIFDSCIEVNEFPLYSPKCIATVRYDLLQPLGPHRKQLKVLDSLLNCGKLVVQEKLLLHPLVETFLYLKWKQLRWFFFLMMLLYMVFTLSLTTMAIFFYVLKTQSPIIDTCLTACRLTLCISLSLITLQELLQALRMQRYYVKDMESWVKWSMFLLSTVVVIGLAIGPPPPDWLVHVAAVAVLLSWLVLLFLLSRWPSSVGFYILMFFTVAKNVMKVLATFTFVILGFTFAFMIHFQAASPFHNWWEALVKVIVMTLEFDYNDLYQGIEGLSAMSVVSRAIFLAFMILVAIVLMNLLVGLAVSDISQLEKQGRAQRLAKQIEFLSLLEVFVYNSRVSSCCPMKLSKVIQRYRATEPNLIIEPGKPLGKTQNIVPFSLRQSVINNIIDQKNRIVDGEISRSSEDESMADPSTSSLQLGNDERTKESADEQIHGADIKESLSLIMSELVIIKQEIENIKQKQS